MGVATEAGLLPLPGAAPMHLDLSDADATALIALLRDTIAADRLPLSPRIRRLRAILAKVEPQPGPAVVYPAPKPSAAPSLALGKKRRR